MPSMPSFALRNKSPIRQPVAEGIKVPLRSRRDIRLWLALTVLSASICARAATVNVWVGAGSQCGTSDLDAAVLAASDSADVTTVIRIADDQNYTGLNLIIFDRNVSLLGGYAHCGDSTPTGRTSIIGANGLAQQGTTISMSTQGGHLRAVLLRDLVVSNGITDLGGGVRVGRLVNATLDNVWVTGNKASEGGGIYIDGGDDVARPSLRLIHHSLIGGSEPGANSATDGGGLYCKHADVMLDGALIAHNQAAYGGGLELDDCTVRSAGSADPVHNNAIYANTANTGAGLEASDGSVVELGLAGGRTNITANAAETSQGLGGGVSVYGLGTRVTLAAAHLTDNVASQEGGGVYVSNGGVFELQRGMRSSVCYVSPCSALANNSAGEGSAIYVDAGGQAHVTTAEITSPSPVTTLYGSSSVLFGDGSNTLIDLTGVLLDHHVAADALRLENGAAAVVSFLTMAGNQLLSDFLLVNANTSLNIQNSIVWDPGALAVDGGGSVFSLNNNSYDPATLPGLNFDPGFVNAMNFDFHLRGDSLNVDTFTPAAYGMTVDIDGNPRPVDLSPDNGGIFDRGAYELGDEIFADGFEPD